MGARKIYRVGIRDRQAGAWDDNREGAPPPSLLPSSFHTILNTPAGESFKAVLTECGYVAWRCRYPLDWRRCFPKPLCVVRQGRTKERK